MGAGDAAKVPGDTVSAPPQITLQSVEAVKAACQRILQPDRRHINEIVVMLKTCLGSSEVHVRHAATLSCASIFSQLSTRGDLKLVPLADAPEGAPGSEAALLAFRHWLRGKYTSFLQSMRLRLQAAKGPIPLRIASVDTMLTLAAMETRCSRPQTEYYVRALQNPRGAYGQLVAGLARSSKPQPPVLERFTMLAAERLDLSFYLLQHVRRLASTIAKHTSPGSAPASAPAQPQRLADLLLAVRPPTTDVPPSKARLLLDLRLKTAKDLPAAARVLLLHKRHRREFCSAWRALLACPLPTATYCRLLAALPDAVLPYVPRPLRYCDLISDGYARGGVEALLSLKGLFILMQRHNLEYPRFYRRLYGLVTAEALRGPHRALFATELQLFLSSVALPAYLTAAFVKRLSRIALFAPPPSAALCLALAYNVLLKHPAIRLLIHRPLQPADGPDTNGAAATIAATPAATIAATTTAAPAAAAASPGRDGAADPFLPDEADPAAARALDSCLWEVDSLRRHHAPSVSSVAALFAMPWGAATPTIQLEPLSMADDGSLLHVEMVRRIRYVALAMGRPSGIGLLKDGFAIQD